LELEHPDQNELSIGVVSKNNESQRNLAMALNVLGVIFENRLTLKADIFCSDCRRFSHRLRKICGLQVLSDLTSSGADAVPHDLREFGASAVNLYPKHGASDATLDDWRTNYG